MRASVLPTALTVAALAFFPGVAGCSDSDADTESNRGHPTASGNASQPGPISLDSAGGGRSSEGPGCVGSEQRAQLTPVYLVFLYDKSGSMGDDPNGEWQNLSLRWNPLKQGMIDFFTNAKTAGVSASLEFFPAPGDKTQTCRADYATPAVAMTPLENPAPLVAALNATSPAGGTPTLPALVGGIQYATRLARERPGAKALVVLVTDGEPAIYNPITQQVEVDCAPLGSTMSNTIPEIASVALGAYQGTPSVVTYVIGIGSPDALGSLRNIARSGGTELILIDPLKAAQTRARISTELEAIRTRQFSCNLPLPSPPLGERLDLGRVNVDFVRSNGTKEELLRSDDCNQPGWQYDDPLAATQIVLCPSACEFVQQDTGGQLNLVVGCLTRVK